MTVSYLACTFVTCLLNINQSQSITTNDKWFLHLKCILLMDIKVALVSIVVSSS